MATLAAGDLNIFEMIDPSVEWNSFEIDTAFTQKCMKSCECYFSAKMFPMLNLPAFSGSILSKYS
jgi:hypothetical protein